MVLRLRLERDASNGSVVTFVGGNQLGSAISFVGAQDPILPALYVKDGGVIVNITRWTITLR
jgi:hypothetical protein